MKYLILLFILFSYSTASAQTVVNRYIDTDCANNGDGTAGTCASGIGLTGAYTTLSNALTDLAVDYPLGLVSADVQVNLFAAGIAEDGSTPTFSLTSNTTDYLHLQCDSGKADGCKTSGGWSTAHYRISNANYNGASFVQSTAFRMTGIQIRSTCNDDCRGKIIGLENCTDGCYFQRNLIAYAPSGTRTTSTTQSGCITNVNNTNANQKIYVANNTMQDCKAKAINVSDPASSSWYIYNNTIVDADGACIEMNAGGTNDIMKARNNIMQGCTGNDWDLFGGTFTTLVTERNITEDATSPDVAFRSLVVTFLDEAGNDFHLSASDTAAKGQASTLSSDGDFPVTLDIDGQTRVAPWDIGSDELSSVNYFTTLQAMGEL